MVYEIETGNIYDDFSKNKGMFDFRDYSARSKYYDDSNALVVGKMKDEISGVAIEEFVRLKPKMYSTVVSNFSRYKKVRGVNNFFFAIIGHNKCKDVLLNKKCLRHLMNIIQSKNH